MVVQKEMVALVATQTFLYLLMASRRQFLLQVDLEEDLELRRQVETSIPAVIMNDDRFNITQLPGQNGTSGAGGGSGAAAANGFGGAGGYKQLLSVDPQPTSVVLVVLTLTQNSCKFSAIALLFPSLVVAVEETAMQTLVMVVDLLVVVLVLVEEFRVHIMVVEHSPTPLAQKVAMDLPM